MKKSRALAALAAVAQETRLDIFRLLVQKGPAGMPAGEIGARMDLPSPTLSFHLNQLRNAGLLSSRRESRSIIYSANYATMQALLAYLTENCCSGKLAEPGCCAGVPVPAAAAPRPRRSTSAATA